MTNTITRISVFVSSPSDLTAERDTIEEVCKEINKYRGRNDGFMLDVVRYETDTHSGKSQDGQMAINEQLLDKMNIYIGIMGAKFGSKTPRAGSGTAEEFDAALDLYNREACQEISFYFKDPRSCEGLSGVELMKVEEFKERVRSEGILTKDFSEVEKFKSTINSELNKIVPKVLEKMSATKPTKSPKTESDIPKSSALKNLYSLEDDEHDGLEELLSCVEVEFQNVVNETTLMAGHVEFLGNEMTKATSRISAATVAHTADNKMLRDIQFREANSVAKAMERYVQGISQCLPGMNRAMDEALSATRKTATLVLSDFEVEPNELSEFATSMTELRETLSLSLIQTGDFIAPIQSLPRMTGDFNRARKRTVAVTKDISDLFERSISQLDDLLELTENP